MYRIDTMALRRKITVKQNTIVKKYVEGQTITQIGKQEQDVGALHSKINKVAEILGKANVRLQLREVLYLRGLTPAGIANKLVDLSNAKKVLIASNRGIITDTLEVNDNTTQLNTMKMITDIAGFNDKDVIDNSISKEQRNKLDSMTTEELRIEIAKADAVEAEYSVISK